MIVALYIFLALVAAGVVLRLLHRPDDSRATEGDDGSAQAPEQEDEGCCGMHITCERDSLLAAVSAETVYYDDEELDRFAGRDADSYLPDEVEEFRDILLTMLPDDIAGWARSLQLRGITLPAAVREELLLVVAETRAARAKGEPTPH